MPRHRPAADPPAVPPLYAHVHPGLEPIAADEITRDLGGDVKRTARGLVVFRLPEITADVLKLRTTEDVFVLAWGSDTLTYKAADLKSITQWTAKQKWDELFRFHHAVRPKPKGKPNFHLVCQMQGEHGYRRVDALDALADGLAGKVPANWVPAEENAWLEVWLTIQGKRATCGVRLSDRTMRHRRYKKEHVAASLRPTMAAAMARLAGAAPGMVVLDPMCGAGTILAEVLDLSRRRKAGRVELLGGDNDPNAVFVAKENLEPQAHEGLTVRKWDALTLPLEPASVDRIVCNPPFGKQLSKPEEIPWLYRGLANEWDRVLKPGGRAVLLVAEQEPLRDAVRRFGWESARELKVRVLGQPAVLSVWQKPGVT
jgi:23S rRNA G2445 N2-methylase RlmL